MIVDKHQPFYKKWWGGSYDFSSYASSSIKVPPEFDKYFAKELFKLFYKDDFTFKEADKPMENAYDQIVFSLDSTYMREYTVDRAWLTANFVEALLNRMSQNSQQQEGKQGKGQSDLQKLLDKLKNLLKALQDKQKQEGKDKQKQPPQKGGGRGEPEEGDDEGESEEGEGEPQEQQQKELSPIEQAIRDVLNQIAELMNKEMQPAMKDVIRNNHFYTHFGLGKLAEDVMNEELQKLAKSLDVSKVGEFIKQFAESGFVGLSKVKLTQNSIFDAVNTFDMVNPEEAILNLLDLKVFDSDKMDLIDVYIDDSGSMSSSSALDGNISRSVLAKHLVLLLRKYIKDVYIYTTDLRAIPYEKYIRRTHQGGGTRTDVCLENMNKNKRAGLVITDSDDNIKTYSKYAYILSVMNFINLTSNKKIKNQYLTEGRLACVSKEGKLLILNNSNSAQYI